MNLYLTYLHYILFQILGKENDTTIVRTRTYVDLESNAISPNNEK